MEESPSCYSDNDKKGSSSRSKSRKSVVTKKNPYPVEDDHDGGELIECSSKYCKSCTAGLIADCVAVCCCHLCYSDSLFSSPYPCRPDTGYGPGPPMKIPTPQIFCSNVSDSRIRVRSRHPYPSQGSGNYRMEESPSCYSDNDKKGSSSRSKSRKSVVTKKNPYPVEDDHDGGELIECSSKYCKSCTAGLIADCVAVCCCPCALLNLLALAFVKLPYMIGKKCLGIEKRKSKKLEKKRKDYESDCGAVERNVGNFENEENLECISSGFSFEDVYDDNVCARFEAEKVWFELYQVGQLGFGRVSFSGIQSSQGKCSSGN